MLTLQKPRLSTGGSTLFRNPDLILIYDPVAVEVVKLRPLPLAPWARALAPDTDASPIQVLRPQKHTTPLPERPQLQLSS